MTSRRRTGKKVQDNGGDVINVSSQGDHNAIAAGRNAKASVSQGVDTSELANWRVEMEGRIDAIKDLIPAEKADLKDNVAKVADEISKGKQANPGRLERLLNMIGVMAPDMLDVAITTLASPLAGIGLVAKKIGDRAKLDAKQS